MMREDGGRSARNGGGMGMYERHREFDQEPRRHMRGDVGHGPMSSGSRHGRARETVRHASIVKVIEVLAESEHGWEDAAQNALHEAQRSIRNIKSIWVKDMQAVVRDGRICLWRLNAKISFAIEPGHDDYEGRGFHEGV